MATQQYYDEDDYDRLHRQLQRSLSTAVYHDRAGPYDYYDHPRHDSRTDHRGRPITRAMVREIESDIIQGNARKRIGVAVSRPSKSSETKLTAWQCSRCRRRKIKCSGDPGNGTGCQACKACGVDASQCNFYRVGTLDTRSCFVTDTRAGWQRRHEYGRRR
jgi:hypothetical protein